MSASLDMARQFLGKEVSVLIDRPLGSKHPKHGFDYPVNYGFVPGTKAPDGAELDAYVLEVDHQVSKFSGSCIAIVHRANDDDDSLVVVPDGTKLSDDEIMAAVDFQEQWFDSSIVRT